MIKRKLYKWMFKKLYFRICNIEQGFFMAGYMDDQMTVSDWRIC